MLEPHWLDNLAEGARLQRWFQFQAFGPTVAFRGGISLVRPIGLNLLVWIPLLSLAAVGWKDASRPVRWATLVVTTLALPMQFAFCVMHEIRALYELLPWLLWLVALGLARLTRVSQR